MYPYIIKYLKLTSTRDVSLKRNEKREFMMPQERDSLFLLCWDAGIVKHRVLTSDNTRVRVFLVFVLVFIYFLFYYYFFKICLLIITLNNYIYKTHTKKNTLRRDINRVKQKKLSNYYRRCYRAKRNCKKSTTGQ